MSYIKNLPLYSCHERGNKLYRPNPFFEPVFKYVFSAVKVAISMRALTGIDPLLQPASSGLGTFFLVLPHGLKPPHDEVAA